MVGEVRWTVQLRAGVSAAVVIHQSAMAWPAAVAPVWCFAGHGLAADKRAREMLVRYAMKMRTSEAHGNHFPLNLIQRHLMRTRCLSKCHSGTNKFI